MSSGRGSAGGGGRSKGGRASATGTASAVAGAVGAAASAPAASSLPAAAAVQATPAQVAKAVAAPAPVVAAQPRSVTSAIDSVAAASPSGGLLDAERVRAAAGATKPASDFAKQDSFDREALKLARDEKVVLHYHDFPSSLSKQELSQMVYDPSGSEVAHGATGTWYIGLAKRRGT